MTEVETENYIKEQMIKMKQISRESLKSEENDIETSELSGMDLEKENEGYSI